MEKKTTKKGKIIFSKIISSDTQINGQISLEIRDSKGLNTLCEARMTLEQFAKAITDNISECEIIK